MSRRSELRREAFQRERGRCAWSLCVSPAEELAHIRGIGRGGNPDGTRDHIANVCALCRFHHDLLDGRRQMKLFEVESLLLEVISKREATHVDVY